MNTSQGLSPGPEDPGESEGGERTPPAGVQLVPPNVGSEPCKLHRGVAAITPWACELIFVQGLWEPPMAKTQALLSEGFWFNREAPTYY